MRNLFDKLCDKLFDNLFDKLFDKLFDIKFDKLYVLPFSEKHFVIQQLNFKNDLCQSCQQGSTTEAANKASTAGIPGGGRFCNGCL